MKVLKFGGTSVGSIEAIRAVGRIVGDLAKRGEDVCVVSSAFSSVTNELIAVAEAARDGDEMRMHSLRHQLTERHMHAAKELIPGSLRPIEISDLLEDLARHLQGIRLLRELSPRTLDLIMSFGERLSCSILVRVLQSTVPEGREVTFCDARKLIRTDTNFGCGVVDFGVTNARIQQHFKDLPKGSIQVVTGFVGSTKGPGEMGETVTLGRGGGDYTASILGGALRAEEIQIWTDVDGVMSAHPGIVGKENALVIERLSYEEAMEMSYFGAKVIYSPTMGPAMQAGVPLRIKNTFNPPAPGTIISKDGGQDEGRAIRAITGIDKVALMVLEGHGMVGVAGVAGRLFSTIARAKVNVIMISQASSEHSICLAVCPDEAERARSCVAEEFEREIERGLVETPVIEDNLAIVAIVGDKMKSTAGIAGLLMGVLGGQKVNVIAIAQGASERNISLAVSRDQYEHAIEVLHHAFFSAVTKQQPWLKSLGARGLTGVPMPPVAVSVYIAGETEVAGKLFERLSSSRDKMLHERNVRISVVGLLGESGMVLKRRVSPSGTPTSPDPQSRRSSPDLLRTNSSLGMDLPSWEDGLKALLSDCGGADTSTFVHECVKDAHELGNAVVFVDCTKTAELTTHYARLASAHVHIVSANTALGSVPTDSFSYFFDPALRAGASRFLMASAVGLNPGVAGTIRSLRSLPTGIHEISYWKRISNSTPRHHESHLAEAVTLGRFARLGTCPVRVDNMVQNGAGAVRITLRHNGTGDITPEEAPEATADGQVYIEIRTEAGAPPVFSMKVPTPSAADSAATAFTDVLSCTG
eukprot:Hpha_TRINITY_DN15382_c2_g7::TRINITY_DN15382_c2_g7_i1::g.91685::m.91685/K12524/thrA; bifunctional aspartokinase / homoserine dehydrogenase 1